MTLADMTFSLVEARALHLQLVHHVRGEEGEKTLLAHEFPLSLLARSCSLSCTRSGGDRSLILCFAHELHEQSHSAKQYC